MIEIIGAPFDLCGMRLGSRLGPAALRLAGLKETLVGLGIEVVDTGDCSTSYDETESEGIRNFKPLLDCIVSLRDMVDSSLKRGCVPVVLGGEHTLAVSCVSAALESYPVGLGLLWIDAHADINTPGSSDSGNVHGMPLAALARMESGTTGKMDQDWQELISALEPGPSLDLQKTVWYGLRDVDPAERSRLSGLAISMHEIDRFGIEATVRRFDQWMREQGVKSLWISFDVDAMDPILAPGTGTAVRGGLTYREAHLCAELIREALEATDCPYSLVGVDLVETNPLYDTLNETAKMAVEWVASLFGKTILGKR